MRFGVIENERVVNKKKSDVNRKSGNIYFNVIKEFATSKNGVINNYLLQSINSYGIENLSEKNKEVLANKLASGINSIKNDSILTNRVNDLIDSLGYSYSFQSFDGTDIEEFKGRGFSFKNIKNKVFSNIPNKVNKSVVPSSIPTATKIFNPNTFKDKLPIKVVNRLTILAKQGVERLKEEKNKAVVESNKYKIQGAKKIEKSNVESDKAIEIEKKNREAEFEYKNREGKQDAIRANNLMMEEAKLKSAEGQKKVQDLNIEKRKEFDEQVKKIREKDDELILLYQGSQSDLPLFKKFGGGGEKGQYKPSVIVAEDYVSEKPNIEPIIVDSMKEDVNSFSNNPLKQALKERIRKQAILNKWDNRYIKEVNEFFKTDISGIESYGDYIAKNAKKGISFDYEAFFTELNNYTSNSNLLNKPVLEPYFIADFIDEDIDSIESFSDSVNDLDKIFFGKDFEVESFEEEEYSFTDGIEDDEINYFLENYINAKELGFDDEKIIELYYSDDEESFYKFSLKKSINKISDSAKKTVNTESKNAENIVKNVNKVKENIEKKVEVTSKKYENEALKVKQNVDKKVNEAQKKVKENISKVSNMLEAKIKKVSEHWKNQVSKISKHWKSQIVKVAKHWAKQLEKAAKWWYGNIVKAAQFYKKMVLKVVDLTSKFVKKITTALRSIFQKIVKVIKNIINSILTMIIGKQNSFEEEEGDESEEESDNETSESKPKKGREKLKKIVNTIMNILCFGQWEAVKKSKLFKILAGDIIVNLIETIDNPSKKFDFLEIIGARDIINLIKDLMDRARKKKKSEGNENVSKANDGDMKETEPSKEEQEPESEESESEDDESEDEQDSESEQEPESEDDESDIEEEFDGKMNLKKLFSMMTLPAILSIVLMVIGFILSVFLFPILGIAMTPLGVGTIIPKLEKIKPIGNAVQQSFSYLWESLSKEIISMSSKKDKNSDEESDSFMGEESILNFFKNREGEEYLSSFVVDGYGNGYNSKSFFWKD